MLKLDHMLQQFFVLPFFHILCLLGLLFLQFYTNLIIILLNRQYPLYFHSNSFFLYTFLRLQYSGHIHFWNVQVQNEILSMNEVLKLKKMEI
jgi:hypothetical protein